MYAIWFFLLIFCGIIGAAQLCAWMYNGVMSFILHIHNRHKNRD
jgi:hypothetical protein